MSIKQICIDILKGKANKTISVEVSIIMDVKH